MPHVKIGFSAVKVPFYEGLYGYAYPYPNYVATYTQDGLQFSTDGGRIGIKYIDDDPALYGLSSSSVIVHSTTVSPFTPESIDFDADDSGAGPVTINVWGYTASGAKVTTTFTTDALPGMQTFAFGPEFTELTELAWNVTTFGLRAVFDNFVATAAAGHVFTGTAGDDAMMGTDGNDLFILGTNTDQQNYYNGGNDRAIGGAGDDRFYFGGTTFNFDAINGGDGNDAIFLQGNYVQPTSIQTLNVETIWLVSGAETQFGDTSGSTYSYNINVGDSVTAGTQIVINGSSLRTGETLTFHGEFETDGQFYLIGGNGDDVLTGGAGDDLLAGGRGADALDGGDGIDTAVYSEFSAAVFVNLTLGKGYTNHSFGDTYANIENVIGSFGNDFIIGDTGVNRLEGGNGDDILLGAFGADTLIGGEGNDWASYEENSGTVFVNLTLDRGYNNGAEGDTLEGIENLVGGLFDDFFIGDENGNRLNGAMGADTLLGAGGADVFMFTYAPGATSDYGSPNVDLILDFTTGEDIMELSSAAFAGLSAGALADGAFHAGSAAHDADDRIIYDSATGQLWFDADGDGAGAAMLFATLGESSHPATIAASDFVVV